MFFRPGPASDPIYCTSRDGVGEHFVKGRAYLEHIWQEVGEYVDDDAAEKAMSNLLPVFWELQVAYALKSAGKCLVPRAQRAYKKHGGPDLLIADTPDVWVEAVVVGAGTGPDALQYPELNKVYDYQSEGVLLRLRSAIQEKSVKIQQYIGKGIITPDQATVIAISGLILPYRYSGIFPPEIVRSVYPTGNPVVEINRETGVVIGSHVEYRDQIKKSMGAEVATTVFLDPTFAHISAVLFGEAGWVDPSSPAGAEFKLVHNATAAVKLSNSWFPVGDEYWWREGGQLERRRHEEERSKA